jgi:hypothetical protein
MSETYMVIVLVPMQDSFHCLSAHSGTPTALISLKR